MGADVQARLNSLESEYKVTVLGDLTKFTGYEVDPSRNGVIVPMYHPKGRVMDNAELPEIPVFREVSNNVFEPAGSVKNAAAVVDLPPANGTSDGLAPAADSSKGRGRSKKKQELTPDMFKTLPQVKVTLTGAFGTVDLTAERVVQAEQALIVIGPSDRLNFTPPVSATPFTVTFTGAVFKVVYAGLKYDIDKIRHLIFLTIGQ